VEIAQGEIPGLFYFNTNTGRETARNKATESWQEKQK